MKLGSFSIAFASILATFAVTGRAATYDEAVNGALSNNYQSPTLIAVTPGENVLKGGLSVAADYATFTIPAGYYMTSLQADSLTNNGGAAFFAIAPGASSPEAPFGSTAAGLLGWVLFTPSNVGQDLLPSMGQSGYGATDFSGPLPAGTYTFWIQDYNETITYQFSFVLEKFALPAVKVNGNKPISVSKNKVKFKGIVTGATSLFYRINNKGAFLPIGSISTFTIHARKLKPGKNTVTFRATGIFGTSTTNVIINYKR